MKKTIVMSAMGSRGDVEPYVALGIELQSLGYKVVISAPGVYGELITANQLIFKELKAVNPQEMMKIPEVESKFMKGNMVGAIWTLMRKSKSVIREYLEEVYKNMQGADAVVLSMIPYGACDAAEKMKVPMIYTLLNPAVPTKVFPTVIMPKIPKQLNYISHMLLEWGFYICFKKETNRLRREEWKLPKVKKCPISSYRKNGGKTLLGYSTALVPKPYDWSENEIITGFWEIKNSAAYIPDNELQQFLSKSDEKPYYIGFGSMPIHNTAEFLKMVEDALEIINDRAIVYLSYNIGELPKHSQRIFIVRDVPHNWLFEQVKATVIHGGIGTCRASITAGKPTFVVPFIGDQYFWGFQIYKLGVGPKPVKLKKLSAVRLAENLKRLNSKNYAINAQSLKNRLKNENGAKTASYEINNILESLL